MSVMFVLVRQTFRGMSMASCKVILEKKKAGKCLRDS